MTQIQLSDAQAVILSAACAREDGAVFPVTTGLTRIIRERVVRVA